MAAAADQIPSPSPSTSTYRFRPTKRELVTYYLLPRARGQDPFPGVLFEDDAAGSTLPWDLFGRHGVESEDEAYFIVRTSEARRPGARQERGCDGGVGVWKTQSSHEKSVRVSGEKIRVHVSNLNLHMEKGKNSGGSVGWVMHEYTIAAPPCPSPVKICHIAFSGHGRKRMRVPDGQQVCRSSNKTARVAVGLCSGAMLDHGSGVPPYASGSGEEESAHLLLTDGDTFRRCPLLDSSDLQSAASEQYSELEKQVPATEQQDIMVPQLMLQQSTMPVAEQLSAGELEFWSSIGVDVQSNNSFQQEQSTMVQSSWVVPNTNAMATGVQCSYVVPSNAAMATGLQSSYEVPSNGIMTTGIESSWVVPNTSTTAGDLDDFCRSIMGKVPNNCVAPNFGNMATRTLGNGTMATGVKSSCVVPNSSAMATGVQSSWMVPSNGIMATGIESSWVVPNTSAMAGDLDDFCRSILARVPNNCAAPDFGNMATGTLGGGCSLICK